MKHLLKTAGRKSTCLNSKSFIVPTKSAREKRIWFKRVRLSPSMMMDSPEDCGEWGGLKVSYKAQMGKFEVLECVCNPRLDEPLC